jgi:hypothetical protein
VTSIPRRGLPDFLRGARGAPAAAADTTEPASAVHPALNAPVETGLGALIMQLLGPDSSTSVGGISERPELDEPPRGAPELPTSGPMGPTKIGPEPSPPLKTPKTGPMGPTKIGPAPRSADEPAKPGAYVANPAAFDSKLDRIKKRVQAETGYSLKVISGRRTADQQKKIFEGQRATGKKVTNADGTIVESKHQSGEAADLRFVDKSGNVVTPKGNDKLWKALGKIAKEEGLVWGGDWTDPYDPGHVQLGVELKRNQ